ncbi:MAG TPA: carboxypeptidase-like regulatory domain-containing protein, partial [Mucilaginibacter sp.]|nr:carboxypeptidase-like regulatory domain-containing protein [Mucilaginibacter sp.]
MNLRLQLLLFVGALLFSSPLLAQKLTGTVTSEGKPVPGTTVVASPSNTGISTDGNGSYTLVLKAAGSYQITFSAIGLATKTLSVTVADGETKVLNVDLLPLAASLSEVIVVGSRGGGRTKIESPVPVDVISVSGLTGTTAKPDLMSQLNQAVPSFN